MGKGLLKNAEVIKGLAQRLQGNRKVRQLGSRHEKPSEEAEAWTLAHAFSDLEESFHKFLDVLLPRLLRAKKGDEIQDLLLDIGDEFEHIIYHIRDPKFYAHLFPKSP